MLSFWLTRFSHRAALVVFALSLLCPLSPARAQNKDLLRADEGVTTRAALVIGNTTYAYKPLTNPAGEAKSVADTMKRLGYTVTVKTNLTLEKMQDAVNEWAETLDDHTLAFVYYSGHGVCHEGKNYLVPIDNGNIKYKRDVPGKAYPFQTILDAIVERGCPLRIFILDACRNDPLPKGLKGGDEQNGLVKNEGPTGTYIAYSARFGETAIDGVYTPALLKNILTPGLPIERLFKRVRGAVLQSSGGEQHPDESSQLIGEFSFAGAVNTRSGDLPPLSKSAAAREYIGRGYEYWAAGKYEQSAAYFTLAIDADAKNTEAYNNRGAAYNGLKQYDKAIADCTEAIRLTPDYAIAYNNRGLAYSNSNQCDKAIADFTRAIRLKPGDAIAYHNRGSTYRQLTQFARAVADLTEAIRLKPDLVAAYNNRGIAYYDLKQFNKAIADYNEAIRLEPDDALAYVNRGDAYNSLRQNDKAIVDYTKAIHLKPDNPFAYGNRGYVYYELQQWSKALTDYRRRVQLSPHNVPDWMTKRIIELEGKVR